MKARSLVLRLHLLIGLSTGGLLLLLGSSGAVLVFRSEIDEAFRAPVQTAATGAPVTLQALVDAARRRHPVFRPTGLVLPEHDGRPARVGMVDSLGGDLEVLVDPHTGEVLGSRWVERSPLHALRLLHAELYMGPRGSVAVGLLGVWLLVQGVTGLYLWWPFVSRPGRGFAIRWSRPWPVVGYDLHRAVGVLSLLFNVPVALTGVLLGLAALAPPAPGLVPPPLASGARPGLVPLPLDAVARRADTVLPGGRLVSLRLSGDGEGVALVRKRMPGDLDPRGSSLVLVDPYGGRILGVSDARQARWARYLWPLVTRLHFGDFGGIVSKALYAVGGLTYSVLVVTGYVVWLSRPRARVGTAREHGALETAGPRR